MIKITNPKTQKFVTRNIMKTVMDLPERNHILGNIIQHSGEKYLTAKFHYFHAKSFSSFRIVAQPVLDIFFNFLGHLICRFKKMFALPFQEK